MHNRFYQRIDHFSARVGRRVQRSYMQRVNELPANIRNMLTTELKKLIQNNIVKYEAARTKYFLPSFTKNTVKLDFKNKDTRYYSIFKEILKALSPLNTSILIYEVGSIQSNKGSVILLVSAVCLDLQCLGYIKQ